MKKFLLLFTLILASLSCSAQINRNFFGLTLGQSTKQQVRSLFEKKGWKLEIGENGDYEVNFDRKIQFGGESWDYICFSFASGKLYSIFLYADEFSDKRSAMQAYSRLKAKLDQKYSTLQTKSYEKDGYTFSHYWDANTNVSLTEAPTSYGHTVSILYYDIPLSDQKDNKALEEL